MAFTIDAQRVLRKLGHRRWFVATIVCTLGLGIGATTALFSVVDATLLRPMPWPSAERIVAVHSVRPDRRTNPVFAKTWDRGQLSWFDWERLREAGAFDKIGVWVRAPFVLAESPADSLEVAHVSASLQQVLGARPALGRLFVSDEDASAAPVAVISHALWLRKYGGRSEVLGRAVVLMPRACCDVRTYQVVGVLEPGFQFPGSAMDVMLPLGLRAAPGSTDEILRSVATIAPGSSMRQASSVAATALGDDAPRTIRFVFLKDELLQGSARALWVLFGGTGLFLILACWNVSGLLVGDQRHRRSEFVIRSMLGADRGVIARQLATEYLTYALMACVLGMALAVLLGHAIQAYAPTGVLNRDVPVISFRISIVALAASLLTPLLFGVVPLFGALSAHRLESASFGNYSISGRHGRGHRQIASAQTAIALVLVVAAILFCETAIRVSYAPLGFNPSNLAVLTITAMEPAAPAPVDGVMSGFDLNAARASLDRARAVANAAQFIQVFDRMSAVQGVAGVAAVTNAPFTGRVVRAQARPEDLPAEADQFIARQVVTSNYFDVMGIRLLQGRSFEPRDMRGPPVAILSNALDQLLFQGRGLGRRIISFDRAIEVVGIAQDVRDVGGGQPGLPIMYRPNWQAGPMSHVVIRTSVDPVPLLGLLSQAVRSDATFAHAATTMDVLLEMSTGEERLRAGLSAVLGALALALSALGLYALTARQVAETNRELGIRFALGGTANHLRLMIFKRAWGTAALGCAIGAPIVPVVWWLGRAMIVGVSPASPHLVIGVICLFAGVSTIAAAVPAGRAACVDPTVMLRD